MQKRWSAVFLLALLAPASGLAQCAMCKQALLNSSEGQHLAGSLNAAILLLIAAPLLVVTAIALGVVHARRRRASPPRNDPRPMSPSSPIRSTFSLRAYVELTKPRIIVMVLVSTAVGFLLGGAEFHSALFLTTLVGLGAIASGAAVLNNYLERDLDTRMKRTMHRPLPSGSVAPASALAFGLSLVLFGVSLLVTTVNLLAGFLALLAAFIYVLVYTPLKRVTWLNTTIGAVPGAIPPLVGWAAATGRLDWGAWALFAILFTWQHPHFYALAWLYRDDYGRAGFKMLPALEPSGERTFRHIVVFSVLLVGTSLLPSALGFAGRVYLAGALVLGLALLGMGLWLWASQAAVAARNLFLGSVIYLPLLWGLLLLVKTSTTSL